LGCFIKGCSLCYHYLCAADAGNDSLQSISTSSPKKNISDIFNCNLKKDYQILRIFDSHISDTTGDQMAVQFSTALIVCFCTTWGNKTNKILHFYPICRFGFSHVVQKRHLVMWELEVYGHLMESCGQYASLPHS